MIKKINAVINDIGFFPTLVYALDRFLKLIFRNSAEINLCHFITQPVPHKRLLPLGLAQSITVRPVEPNDLGDADLPLTSELLQDRKNKGVVCLGVYDGGRLLGFHCFSFRSHDDEMYRARFNVGPDGKAVWDFDIFILTTHRCGLTFAHLWDGVFDYLRERDIAWLTSYISATNSTSLKSHLRMGSVKLGSAIFLRLGMLQMIFSTRSPYLHVSLADNVKPSFRLNAPEASGPA